jgi:hypothetical protein
MPLFLEEEEEDEEEEEGPSPSVSAAGPPIGLLRCWLLFWNRPLLSPSVPLLAVVEVPLLLLLSPLPLLLSKAG